MKRRIANIVSANANCRKYMRVFAIGTALAFMLVALSGFVAAQNTVTGAFQGKVTSVTGGDIPGAAVRITNEKTLEVYILITDSRGEFYQGLLAPGVYLIDVEIADFKPRRLRRPLNITRTGEVVPVPVSLEPIPPGTVAAPVAAAGESADDIRVEINTIDARRDGSFDEEKIAVIPLGSTTITRTLDELALLLPGVAPPPQTIGDVAGPGVGPGVGSAGQFAVNGLRSRANNFTVDGSDNNDEDIGVRRQGFVALSSQPIESVQEFQIITLLAPAQFGRNIGAQVNIVSKTGGSKTAGSVYGFFNSDELNARNFFDTANGNDSFALTSATGQPVLLDGQPLMVRNNSGGEDSFTAVQGGGNLGGAIVPERLFYFVSGEYQKINASQEKSFVVPTVEQRGAFGTGASGIFRDPFTNAPIAASPNSLNSIAFFSLFPFANNPDGIYGENTLTRVLPASGRGVILSSRIDNNFAIAGRQQSITGRYNFTDDEKNIPAVGEAVFATVVSNIQTQNLSLFLNSQISDPKSETQILNQVRFSFGRTSLSFEEVRDREHLVSSGQLPGSPFLLNAPLRFNTTVPAIAGMPNTGPISFRSTITGIQSPTIRTAEELLGPLGQVSIAGFSSLGVDVYNFPQERVNNTYQIADELSVRQGNHNYVFGADVRRTDLISDLPRLSRPLVTFNGSPRVIPTGPGTFRFPNSSDLNPVIRPEDLAGLEAASNVLFTFNVDREDAKANLRFYQFNFYGQDTWRARPNLSLSFGLRYEYNTPVSETDRLIENTFDDPRLDLAPGLRNFIDGRDRLYEPDYNNFGPRLGVAYSPEWFGNRRLSVIRAGYGLFYDQILGAVVSQSRNVFPTYYTVNFGGSEGTGLAFLGFTNPALTSILANQNQQLPLRVPGTDNTFNPAVSLPALISYLNRNFPNAITATLPAKTLETPMAHHYSIEFEQQLSSNYALSIGYVGTAGRKLLRFTTPNLGSSITVSPTQLFPVPIFTNNGVVPTVQYLGQAIVPNRPVSGIGAVNLFETNASSNYNSLQTRLKGRFIAGLDFQASYVYSKVSDDVSDVFDLAGAYALPQNSLDLKAEYGPANFDVRHRFVYNLDYDFSGLSLENRIVKSLVKDLHIAGTGRFHTGQPFTVNSIIDVNLDGNLTDRLDTMTGLAVTGDGEQPLRIEAINPYTLLAPFGHDGQIGRNSFRAGKVLELDVSISKRLTAPGGQFIFRTDIFNILNRANFGVPIRLLEAPDFGKATNTVTSPRRIQLSLKYEF